MKVLIVDDHPLFLQGLKSVFKADKAIKICGEARDGREAITQVKKLKPEIVIMDINMPGINGRHEKFGDGIVVNCTARNVGDHEVTVDFSEYGIKRLLLSLAPLEKL